MTDHSDRGDSHATFTLTRRGLMVGAAWAAAGPLAGRIGLVSDALAQPAPKSNAITVTLLGTGTPNPRPTRFGPSTLVEAGGKRLVIDAGRGMPTRLFQLKIPLREIDGVFITHFHSDHLNGLPDFFLTSYIPTPYARRRTPMKLYGPTGTARIAEAMRSMYADDARIRMADEHVPEAATEVETKEFSQDGVIFDEDGVKVTAFKVHHGDLIKPSYGYRVDYAGRSVLLSGDTTFNENLIKHGTGVDLLLHEVCVVPDALKDKSPFKEILNHHTSPEECGVVFTRTKPKLAGYTHIVQVGNKEHPPLNDDAIVQATRKTYQGPLALGVDLMRFVIADDVRVLKWDAQRKGYPT
jgi:ribonuclease Z